MGISPLLQIRRIIERGASADVSIGYLSVLAVGIALWATHGFSIANAALVASHSVSLVVSVSTITAARGYRRRVIQGRADRAPWRDRQGTRSCSSGQSNPSV